MTEPNRRSDVRRNREALLHAAAEVLAADPSASMEDIAVRAGLGRATVYRHVAGRPELLLELVAWAIESAGRAVAAAQPAEGPADVALRRVLDGLADEAVLFRALVVLNVTRGPDFAAARDAALSPGVRTIRRGQEAGIFRRDLEPNWAIAALVALLQTALVDGYPDPARLVWQTLVEGWRVRS